MNETQRSELLRGAFAAAIDSQPAVDGPHIATDVERLSRWTTGKLSEQEHNSLLDHLAVCHACRKDLARMVQAGELLLPEVPENDTKTTETILPVAGFDRSHRRVVRTAWAAFAVAATLLFALWLWPGASADDALRLAQADPLGEFEQLLSGRMTKATRSLPFLDPEVQKQDEAFRQSLAESPDDKALLLDYGLFLLEQRRFAPAQEQFVAAQESRSYRNLAEFGLGLVDFHRGRRGDTTRLRSALEHFDSVIEADPENFNAHVYAALCLKELRGSTAAAVGHLKQAEELTTRNALQKSISAYIERIGLEEEN